MYISISIAYLLYHYFYMTRRQSLSIIKYRHTNIFFYFQQQWMMWLSIHFQIIRSAVGSQFIGTNRLHKRYLFFKFINNSLITPCNVFPLRTLIDFETIC